MKKIILLFALAVVALGCKKDDDGGEPTPQNVSVDFKFTQNFGGIPVTQADFNSSVYTNAAGNFLSISKLRYLISRISLHKADGTSVDFTEYQLVDLTEPTTLTLSPALNATTGDYTGISFIYGFNEADNESGA